MENTREKIYEMLRSKDLICYKCDLMRDLPDDILDMVVTRESYELMLGRLISSQVMNRETGVLGWEIAFQNMQEGCRSVVFTNRSNGISDEDMEWIFDPYCLLKRDDWKSSRPHRVMDSRRRIYELFPNGNEFSLEMKLAMGSIQNRAVKEENRPIFGEQYSAFIRSKLIVQSFIEAGAHPVVDEKDDPGGLALTL